MFTIQVYPQAQARSAPLAGLAAAVQGAYGPLGNGRPLPELAKEAGLDLAAALPEAGGKTALLLADALLNHYGWNPAHAPAMARALDEVAPLLDKAAPDFGGVVPGGGLWLLGLARPLYNITREQPALAEALHPMVLALKAPFLCLAESAGCDPYDAYAQVKASAPPQFFSLHHHGLKGSVSGESPYADLPRFGLDVRSARFADLPKAGVTHTPEEAKAVLAALPRLIALLREGGC